MLKKVLVPIADGTEELEAVSIIDVLRRAGAEVTVASVSGPTIVASSGTRITADKSLSDCLDENYDLIALPGGLPGSENLRDSKELTDLLKRQQRENRLLGAICASPAVVLHHHGLIGERKAVAYPGFETVFENPDETGAPVIIDGKVVTSRGVGTALNFALTLTDLLFGRTRAEEVAASIVTTYP